MNGILLETDVITEFLLAETGTVPLFRRLLQITPCYTTFIQAAEIYSTASSDEDSRILDKALFGVKVLGASSRYAKTIGKLLALQTPPGEHRSAIVAAMALESGLPIVTDQYYKTYTQIPDIRLLSRTSLQQITHDEELETVIQSMTV